jgi:hypothetical protein
MEYFICPKHGNSMKEKLARSSNVPYFLTFCGLTTVPSFPLTMICLSRETLLVFVALISVGCAFVSKWLCLCVGNSDCLSREYNKVGELIGSLIEGIDKLCSKIYRRRLGYQFYTKGINLT